MTTHTADDPVRTLVWPHGRATLERLGAMLAPVTFSAPGQPDFAPMQVAPWADEPGHESLPGLMRRLRGDWPCVPFGRTDPMAGLPEGWRSHDADNEWGHGYSAHHLWQWLPQTDPTTLALAITTPDGVRMTRSISGDPKAPALDLTLRIEVPTPRTLPVALHPTLRLDAGRVALDVPHAGPGLTYPIPAEPVVSHLAPNRRFGSLRAVPRADGGEADLTHFPQPSDGEELMQLMQVTGPVTLRYLDRGWAVSLDWDRALLPDMLLWVSHRGRQYAPWNGRHMALGIEPANSVFDVARVATPPADHPLAGRGLALHPDTPCVIRYRLAAQPLSAR